MYMHTYIYTYSYTCIYTWYIYIIKYTYIHKYIYSRINIDVEEMSRKILRGTVAVLQTAIASRDNSK